MKKKYLSRRIELTDAEGIVSCHDLSIVSIDDYGNIELSPYVSEVHSVEYVDGMLRLSQDDAGRWHKSI